jgi:hypothetical protein
MRRGTGEGARRPPPLLGAFCESGKFYFIILSRCVENFLSVFCFSLFIFFCERRRGAEISFFQPLLKSFSKTETVDIYIICFTLRLVISLTLV